MPKTTKELALLKQEYQTLKAKLDELSEDELNEITGGLLVRESTTKSAIIIPSNDNLATKVNMKVGPKAKGNYSLINNPKNNPNSNLAMMSNENKD